MIKIDKSLNENDIPSSLLTKKVKDKLHEMLIKGEYIENSLYKSEDVQNKLAVLYHNKCAYCESKTKGIVIEHYRPKSKYWWLSLSWDNLLFICSHCNSSKGDKFEVETEIKNPIEDYIVNQHTSTERYNQIEKPKCLHPEIDNIAGIFYFEKTGEIFSDDARGKTTIKLCNLNHQTIKVNRKKVYDDLEKQIKSILIDSKYSIEKRQSNFEYKINEFKETAANFDNEFSAFLQYIKNNWMEEFEEDAKFSI